MPSTLENLLWIGWEGPELEQDDFVLLTSGKHHTISIFHKHDNEIYYCAIRSDNSTYPKEDRCDHKIPDSMLLVYKMLLWT